MQGSVWSDHEPQLPGVPISQAGFLPGELSLSSPGPLSPSGIKSSSQYYPSFPSNPRRRAADGGLGE
jgi:transcription factor E2-alpha